MTFSEIYAWILLRTIFEELIPEFVQTFLLDFFLKSSKDCLRNYFNISLNNFKNYNSMIDPTIITTQEFSQKYTQYQYLHSASRGFFLEHHLKFLKMFPRSPSGHLQRINPGNDLLFQILLLGFLCELFSHYFQNSFKHSSSNS